MACDHQSLNEQISSFAILMKIDLEENNMF
jgi:hypothetical protein